MNCLKISNFSYLCRVHKMQKKIQHKGGSLFCGVTLIGVVLLVFFHLLPGTSLGVHARGEEVNHRERNGIHVDCSFFDTVNVTGFPSFPNGSYLYEGVMIPCHYVGTFDYIYTNLVDRVDVAPHTRACICKFKPCINICCPWGQIFNNSECQNDTSTDHLWPEKEINVTLKDGSIQSVNMYQKFVVQSFRPCSEMFSLIPQANYYDNYTLFENGTLLREDDGIYLSKNEYCMVPTVVNKSDLYYIINPANCDMLNENTTVKIINGFGKMYTD